MADHTPHPANATGDFYVEENCCTMCGVPFDEAPDLFGAHQRTNYTHCYVKRQPKSPAELEQMINAARLAELQCIRYRGPDRLVQLRLVEGGVGGVCDELPLDLHREVNRREAEWRKRPWWRFW